MPELPYKIVFTTKLNYINFYKRYHNLEDISYVHFIPPKEFALMDTSKLEKDLIISRSRLIDFYLFKPEIDFIFNSEFKGPLSKFVKLVVDKINLHYAK